MSVSFPKKTVVEVLILMAGAVLAAAGKQQNSPRLPGLGVVVIGAGVIWGGIALFYTSAAVGNERGASALTAFNPSRSAPKTPIPSQITAPIC